MGRRNNSKKSRIDVSSNAMNHTFGGGGLASQLSSFHHLDSLEPNLDRPVEHYEEPSQGESSLLSPLGAKKTLKLAILKKGRGGKVVTTLQCLASSNHQSIQKLVKALGKSLGCRVWSEETLIYLQGDQRDRINFWVENQP